MFESIISSVLTSGILIAGAAFILKQYWEKRVMYYFDRRLQELSADLGVRSAVEIEVNRKRIDDYSRIAQLVKRSRKLAERVYRNTSAEQQSLIDEWETSTKELETEIYRAVLSLRHDSLYDLLHACKNGFVVARNYIMDQQHLYMQGYTDQADKLAHLVEDRIKSINLSSEEAIEKLEAAINSLVKIR